MKNEKSFYYCKLIKYHLTVLLKVSNVSDDVHFPSSTMKELKSMQAIPILGFD